MAEIVYFPHITFKDVTNDIKRNVEDDQCLFEAWQCWYVGTYVGLITWSSDNEQYCFYPALQTQIILNTTALEDIYEKIWSLMKDRTLN